MSLAFELLGRFHHFGVEGSKVRQRLRKVFFDNLLPLHADAGMVFHVCLSPTFSVFVRDVSHTEENLYQSS